MTHFIYVTLISVVADRFKSNHDMFCSSYPHDTNGELLGTCLSCMHIFAHQYFVKIIWILQARFSANWSYNKLEGWRMKALDMSIDAISVILPASNHPLATPSASFINIYYLRLGHGKITASNILCGMYWFIDFHTGTDQLQHHLR